MKKEIRDFLRTFAWYRDLTKRLVKEMPQDHFNTAMCDRSSSPSIQFFDMGDFQLRVVGRIVGKDLQTQVPKPKWDTSSKQDLINYLEACDALMTKELTAFDKSDITFDWYGRMKFNLHETLGFLLAHEAMHHGELLSFIFKMDLPMPAGFKETWGFDAP